MLLPRFMKKSLVFFDSYFAGVRDLMVLNMKHDYADSGKP